MRMRRAVKHVDMPEDRYRQLSADLGLLAGVASTLTVADKDVNDGDVSA